MRNLTFPSFTFDANPNSNYLLLLLILAGYSRDQNTAIQAHFHDKFHQTYFMHIFIKQNSWNKVFRSHNWFNTNTHRHLSHFRWNQMRKRSTCRRHDTPARYGGTNEVETERKREWRGIGVRAELRRRRRRRRIEWRSWDEEEEAQENKWIRVRRQYIFLKTEFVNIGFFEKKSILTYHFITSVFSINQC